MYKVIILQSANQDVKDATEWYEKKQKGLGKRFLFQIRHKLKLLRKDSFSAAIRFNDTRTAVLDIFPFMIHYKIDEINKLLTISAILHTTRNPGIWKSEI